MVSLGEYLYNATADELTEFRDDIKQLVYFIQPILERYKSDIQAQINGPLGIRWDEKSLSYQTNVISINGPKNLGELVWAIIHDYDKTDPGQIQKFYKMRPWFNKDFPLLNVNIPLVAVIERMLHGESLDGALDAEMKTILEMRDSLEERVAQFIIQNLVLEDETILDFKTYTVEIKEHELRISYQENEKPPELRIEKIPYMLLTLKSRVRRLSALEYQQISPRAMMEDRYNISTVVEFFYKLPRELYSNGEASRLIEDAMGERIKCIQRALMLTLFGDFPTAQIHSEYTNKYRRYLFGDSFPLYGPKYHSTFFTGKKILKKNFFSSLVELQEILLKMHGSKRVEEGLDLLARADGIMRIDQAQTIVMYWSFLEKFINGKQFFLMGIAAYLYGCNNTEERRNEFNFLRTLNHTRNGYVHGRPMDDISQNIKKYYPIHSINSIALVAREKMFRIFLFSILLLQKSKKGPDDPTYLFNWGKERMLGRGCQPVSEALFNKWINNGSNDELGDIGKYKRGYRTNIRMI